jgi:hypothetical protein
MYDLTGTEYPTASMSALTEYIKTRRENVLAFLKAIIHGIFTFRHDRSYAIRVLGKILFGRQSFLKFPVLA